MRMTRLVAAFAHVPCWFPARRTAINAVPICAPYESCSSPSPAPCCSSPLSLRAQDQPESSRERDPSRSAAIELERLQEDRLPAEGPVARQVTGQAKSGSRQGQGDN